MSVKVKIPLINNQIRAIKIIGYGFVALMLMGLVMAQDNTVAEPIALDDYGNPIEYDTSSAGQTGQVEYVTPEGTITVDLPTGFYLRNKLGANGIWSISAAKTEPNCVYGERSMASEDPLCPGHELTITWGKQNYNFESGIDSSREYFGSDGDYITTASGHTAWAIAGDENTNGRYAVQVSYSDDENKWMSIVVVPITEEGSPTQSMSHQEFEDFVKSIEIR